MVSRTAGGARHAVSSRRLLLGLRRATRKSASGVTLLITGDREIRTLNRRHLGHDRTTDVLSFPAEALEPGVAHLGDIAVSLPRARRQARRAGWPIHSEMALLVTHGYLHLLGHDHETDDGTMHRLEARLLAKVARVRLDRRRLPWGLAATYPSKSGGAGRAGVRR
ncbi:MAG TPA: rRNA maturation RNase YbeY [Candidatus Polarisedimenticolia bacterium]|nr:rRNA maturation RNase YbeY [Candidatus Polarisedimenticolia bacterium]